VANVMRSYNELRHGFHLPLIGALYQKLAGITRDDEPGAIWNLDCVRALQDCGSCSVTGCETSSRGSRPLVARGLRCVALLTDGSFGPAIGIGPFDLGLRPQFGEIRGRLI
jgi:hypothetical protein